MEINELSKYYRKTEKELSNSELIALGREYAQYLKYIVQPYYESWEFESEDLPGMIDDGLKYGVIEATDDEKNNCEEE